MELKSDMDDYHGLFPPHGDSPEVSIFSGVKKLKVKGM